MGLPTVEAILDKYVKAVGGKEAIEKVTSRSMKASFDLEAFGVTGAPVEMFAKAPNKSSTKIDVPGFGVVNRVFDGATGWHSDPASGLRELSGVELAQFKRGSDFYAELNYNKHYAKMEVKGKEKVGSYETYVIEATPAEGSSEKLYFAVNTGLLVRHDMESHKPRRKDAIRNLHGRLQGCGRRQNPAYDEVRQSDDDSWVMKITEVKNNVEIDEAKFNKPSN